MTRKETKTLIMLNSCSDYQFYSAFLSRTDVCFINYAQRYKKKWDMVKPLPGKTGALFRKYMKKGMSVPFDMPLLNCC